METNNTDIEQIARIQFYVYSIDAYTDEEGKHQYNHSHTFVPAVRCKDMYKANMTEGN